MPEPILTDSDKQTIFDTVQKCVDAFGTWVKILEDSLTFSYLNDLVSECYVQYFKDVSLNNLPLLFKEENFPLVYDYFGTQTDEDAAFKTMCGWICAMQMSELYPYRRSYFYKAGYELGGYTMNSNVYGYAFRSDPNVVRLVSSVIWSAMRSVCQPDVTKMRTEVGGNSYPDDLQKTYDKTSRTKVSKSDFFIDFRKFMNSAPGPYSPGYADRSDINPTFPDKKASNKCLQIDMDIYNYIVEHYNLDEQHAVQAIADEDADPKHLFDTDKRNVGDKYDFNAVFGETTVGRLFSPSGYLSNFVCLNLSVGSTARGILQHADSSVGHYEYGRMRPGCSEQQEGCRKSRTDDRLNVLANFLIEDNDGNKVTYEDGGVEKPYYDENGNWTSKVIKSPEEYEDKSKDWLWANSYPSGHSSGIWSAALTLVEICPEIADKIMRAANAFAVNRTVARYHWNSDTIQGRLIGAAICPVSHATAGYQESIDKAKKEVHNS